MKFPPLAVIGSSPDVSEGLWGEHHARAAGIQHVNSNILPDPDDRVFFCCFLLEISGKVMHNKEKRT
jgi:hypothetical protein